MHTPESFDELIHQELDPWITLSQLQVAQLRIHYDLLVRWNKKMNLTTVKPGREMVVRHYCESLFFAQHIPAEADSAVSLIDVGSGAGFPGIPVAVLRPTWEVTLVESNQRKCVFLRESTRHVQNVAVLAKRIEEVEDRGEWVVSRAVDPQEIVSNVPRIANNIGLMLSEQEFLEMKSQQDIAWSEPIRLPWGDRRLCVYGSTWNKDEDCST